MGGRMGVGRVRILLLVDVRDAEGLLVPITCGSTAPGFEQAGLVEGCVVQFRCPRHGLQEGYRGHVWSGA